MSQDTKLNEKQNEAYSLMASKKNLLLTGCGGVGKSYLIKKFVRTYCHSRNIAVTSTTGTSALLIGGTTLHSYLGIGLGTGNVDFLVDRINKMFWLKKRWLDLDCLIIDEISMLDPALFDKLETVARKIRCNIRPFGNIQLILSGDFLQLPSVGTDYFCFEAKSWRKCITNVICLTEIIRQSNKHFQNILNSIRIGDISDEVKDILNSRIGIELKNEYGIKPTKLFSKNWAVDRVNNNELDILAEDGREFFEYEMDIMVYPEVKNKQASIDKYLKFCSFKQSIQLCIGAQVMLSYNLDMDSGLCNGSRGVVVDFRNDLPVVKFLNGQIRIIEPQIYEFEESEKKILRASQIPLKIAYALSIHSCQGSSLDYAEIDLSEAFACGQSYTALSRVKNLEGLSIIDIDYGRIYANETVLEFYKNL